MLLDVYRGELVIPHDVLAEDDGVLEVSALPGHECDQHVLAQGELAPGGGRAIRERLAGPNPLPLTYQRALIHAGTLVRAHVLPQLV